MAKFDWEFKDVIKYEGIEYRKNHDKLEILVTEFLNSTEKSDGYKWVKTKAVADNNRDVTRKKNESETIDAIAEVKYKIKNSDNIQSRRYDSTLISVSLDTPIYSKTIFCSNAKFTDTLYFRVLSWHNRNKCKVLETPLFIDKFLLQTWLSNNEEICKNYFDVIVPKPDEVPPNIIAYYVNSDEIRHIEASDFITNKKATINITHKSRSNIYLLISSRKGNEKIVITIVAGKNRTEHHIKLSKGVETYQIDQILENNQYQVLCPEINCKYSFKCIVHSELLEINNFTDIFNLKRSIHLPESFTIYGKISKQYSNLLIDEIYNARIDMFKDEEETNINDIIYIIKNCDEFATIEYLSKYFVSNDYRVDKQFFNFLLSLISDEKAVYIDSLEEVINVMFELASEINDGIQSELIINLLSINKDYLKKKWIELIKSEIISKVIVIAEENIVDIDSYHAQNLNSNTSEVVLSITEKIILTILFKIKVPIQRCSIPEEFNEEIDNLIITNNLLIENELIYIKTSSSYVEIFECLVILKKMVAHKLDPQLLKLLIENNPPSWDKYSEQIIKLHNEAYFANDYANAIAYGESCFNLHVKKEISIDNNEDINKLIYQYAEAHNHIYGASKAEEVMLKAKNIFSEQSINEYIILCESELINYRYWIMDDVNKLLDYINNFIIGMNDNKSTDSRIIRAIETVHNRKMVTQLLVDEYDNAKVSLDENKKLESVEINKHHIGYCLMDIAKGFYNEDINYSLKKLNEALKYFEKETEHRRLLDCKMEIAYVKCIIDGETNNCISEKYLNIFLNAQNDLLTYGYKVQYYKSFLKYIALSLVYDICKLPLIKTYINMLKYMNVTNDNRGKYLIHNLIIAYNLKVKNDEIKFGEYYKKLPATYKEIIEFEIKENEEYCIAFKSINTKQSLKNTYFIDRRMW